MRRTSPIVSASCSIGCTCKDHHAYESILFESADGIARITLNRPDRLNSFTAAMHAELRDALAAVKADARHARAAAHRRRARLLRGTGPVRSRRRAGQRAGRPGRVDREELPSAGPRAARAAAAGGVRGQRRGRRCRRQHRARVRHRHRGEIGELHPGVLQDRPHPGFGRHVFPAAARRLGARDGSRAARRQAVRRAGGRVGPHLEVRRGQRAQSDGRGAARAVRAGAHARARRDQARAPGARRTPRSRRSSISSATCSARWATATTIAKVSRRSSPSARRNSRGADRMADALAAHVGGAA